MRVPKASSAITCVMVILGPVLRLGHLFHLPSGGTVPLAGLVAPGCCGGRTRGEAAPSTWGTKSSGGRGGEGEG